MKRQRVISAALIVFAVLGAFGLIQINAVRLIVPWQGALGAAVVLTLGLAALAGLFDSAKVGLHSRLEDNPSHRLGGLRYMSRDLRVTIAEGTTYRRDAEFVWTLRVRNTSHRYVGEMRLAQIGEVALHAGQLHPSASVDGDTFERVAVDTSDPHSPVIVVPFPSPGLRPDAISTVVVRYRWPGIAGFPTDHWILDLTNLSVGGSATLTLEYPPADKVHGTGQLLTEHLGVRRFRPIGAARHREKPEAHMVTLSWIRRKRRERAIYLHTDSAS